MLKDYLLDIYILFFEKIYNSNNRDLINKVWQKIKINNTLLEYAITTHGNTFRSKIIAYMLLKEKDLYNTPIYLNLVNKIYNNRKLAEIKVRDNATSTFLMLTLENEELKLDKEQKLFLIFETEKCPHTEKYYQEKRTDETNIHGVGIRDIRYKILQNQSFTIEEKTNLFMFFYPDNDVKIDILNELEWEVAKELGIANEKDYSGIYILEPEDIKKKIKDEKKQQKVIDKINLCKYITSKIPEEEIIKYKNND